MVGRLGTGHSASPVSPTGIHESDNPPDNVICRKPRRIHQNRIRSWSQGSDGPVLVLTVPRYLVGEHRFEGRSDASGGQLRKPPACPLLRARRQEDLRLGRRKHNRPDVPSFEHGSVRNLTAKPALELQQSLPDRRARSHHRGHPRHIRCPDRVGHVFAVARDKVRAILAGTERDGQAGRRLSKPGDIVRIDPSPDSLQSDTSVESTRVDEREAQPARNEASHRALSSSCRSVNGNDEAHERGAQ